MENETLGELAEQLAERVADSIFGNAIVPESAVVILAMSVIESAPYL